MAARAAGACTAPPSEEAARAPGAAGAAAAGELSGWLAQALVEERRAVRSALERSHQESRDALDRELGSRHEALVAKLQGQGRARDARTGPECLPAVPPDLLAVPPCPSRTPSRQAPEDQPDGQALRQSASSASASLRSPARLHSVRSSVKAQQQQLYAAHLTPPRTAAEADNTDEVGLAGKNPSTRSVMTLSSIGSPFSFTRGGSQTAADPDSERLKSAAIAAVDMQDRVSSVLWGQRGSRRSQKGKWVDFVEGAKFEMMMGVLIILNGVQMAFEVQYSGLKRGYDFGYRAYAKTPDPWPGAEGVLYVVGIFFGVIFACEVSFKLCALRSAFFKLPWNVFDLIVVLFWLVEMTAVVKEHLENSTALRLARLARLLRLLRVVRQIRSFDALFLMTTAIRSSLVVLAWSCMLLLMIQVLFAFTINQYVNEFYFEEDYPQNEKDDVFEYFGTFSRALLSTFEMTLANWPPICRLLMENVSEWFMVVCLLHKLTVGFAVLGVINGVFIQETFRVAAQDDFIMVHQKENAMRIHLNKMSRLFKAGDASGDGLLDKTEFLMLMQNSEVKTWLSSMGLDAGDEDALFEYLDKDEDGNVSAEELIKGVSCLKGAARSLDLIMCLNQVDELKQALQDVRPGIMEQKRCRGPFFTSRWVPAGPADSAV